MNENNERLILDLHIKAASAQEAEAIAAKIEAFERLTEYPVGTGIEDGSFRVRGSLKLSDVADVASFAAIHPANETTDTQNRFLDAGWKVSRPLGMSFEREMPRYRTNYPTNKPEKTPPRTLRARIGDFFKQLLKKD